MPAEPALKSFLKWLADRIRRARTQVKGKKGRSQALAAPRLCGVLILMLVGAVLVIKILDVVTRRSAGSMTDHWPTPELEKDGVYSSATSPGLRVSQMLLPEANTTAKTNTGNAASGVQDDAASLLQHTKGVLPDSSDPGQIYKVERAQHAQQGSNPQQAQAGSAVQQAQHAQQASKPAAQKVSDDDQAEAVESAVADALTATKAQPPPVQLSGTNTDAISSTLSQMGTDKTASAVAGSLGGKAADSAATGSSGKFELDGSSDQLTQSGFWRQPFIRRAELDPLKLTSHLAQKSAGSDEHQEAVKKNWADLVQDSAASEVADSSVGSAQSHGLGLPQTGSSKPQTKSQDNSLLGTSKTQDNSLLGTSKPQDNSLLGTSRDQDPLMGASKSQDSSSLVTSKDQDPLLGTSQSQDSLLGTSQSRGSLLGTSQGATGQSQSQAKAAGSSSEQEMELGENGLPLDFDWQTYLALNPDVDAGEGHSEAAASLHWRVWGKAEGRPYKTSMLSSGLSQVHQQAQQ